jgi:hypothetical protein
MRERRKEREKVCCTREPDERALFPLFFRAIEFECVDTCPQRAFDGKGTCVTQASIGRLIGLMPWDPGTNMPIIWRRLKGEIAHGDGAPIWLTWT